MSSYIGIDLAGRTTNRTSLAVITTTASQPKLTISGRDVFKGKKNEEVDRYLIETITSRRPVAVGIDSPLSLPRYLQNPDKLPADEIPDYLYRRCDKESGGMSTMYLGALTARGIFLKNRFSREGIEVIEVYPRKTLEGLKIKNTPALKGSYKQDPAQARRIYRSLGLEAGFQIEPGFKLSDDHDLDAVLAVLTVYGYQHHRHLTATIGDEEEGQIVYLTKKFW
jgi:predicted nuclease with RNAse H fold